MKISGCILLLSSLTILYLGHGQRLNHAQGMWISVLMTVDWKGRCLNFGEIPLKLSEIVYIMPSKHQACSQSSCDSWLACKWLWLQSVNSRVLHVCVSDVFARCIMEVEAMMSVVSCPFYQVHANLPNWLCQVVKVTLLSCQVHFAKCISPSHQVHIQFVMWTCHKLLKACKRNKRMQKCHNNVHFFLFLKGIQTILKLIL
jgi:hypothetical protein